MSRTLKIMENEKHPLDDIMLNDIRYRLEELLQTKVDLVHGPLPADGLLEIDRRITLYGA